MIFTHGSMLIDHLIFPSPKLNIFETAPHIFGGAFLCNKGAVGKYQFLAPKS